MRLMIITVFVCIAAPIAMAEDLDKEPLLRRSDIKGNPLTLIIDYRAERVFIYFDSRLIGDEAAAIEYLGGLEMEKLKDGIFLESRSKLLPNDAYRRLVQWATGRKIRVYFQRAAAFPSGIIVFD